MCVLYKGEEYEGYVETVKYGRQPQRAEHLCVHLPLYFPWPVKDLQELGAAIEVIPQIPF